MNEPWEVTLQRMEIETRQNILKNQLAECKELLTRCRAEVKLNNAKIESLVQIENLLKGQINE